jgi:hypothetical protein
MRADGALVGQCTPFSLLSTRGLTKLNSMQLNVKAHPLKATFDCQRKPRTSDLSGGMYLIQGRWHKLIVSEQSILFMHPLSKIKEVV